MRENIAFCTGFIMVRKFVRNRVPKKTEGFDGRSRVFIKGEREDLFKNIPRASEIEVQGHYMPTYEVEISFSPEKHLNSNIRENPLCYL